MSKLDTLFQEIMSDEDMRAEFGYTPADYSSIERGSKSRNKYSIYRKLVKDLE